MSARIHVRENKLILEDELVTGEVFTKGIDMQVMEGCAFHILWSGGTDIDGELTVESSLDNINYCTFAGSNINISGTSGGHMYDIVDTHVRYLRIRINISSGSSIFNVRENLRTREA